MDICFQEKNEKINKTQPVTLHKKMDQESLKFQKSELAVYLNIRNAYEGGRKYYSNRKYLFLDINTERLVSEI